MKVLVADDELGSLLVAQATVQGLGHECLTAIDGSQAWTLFRQEAPDIVLTDLTMPYVDGLELCRQIRAQQHDAYTYLILLTSHDRPADVLAGMRAGADDYLTKPLDPLDLEARLLAASRVTQLHAHLAAARAELQRQATTDVLTGLRNRSTLNTDLEELHLRSARYQHNYCIALCDVDYFKRYNDTYGHPSGDRALRTVAATFRSELRDVDRVYRYGGEEFLVLLPEQTLTGATVALDRVRRRLQEIGVPHQAGGPEQVLTMSAGVAGYEPARPGTCAQRVTAADAALYDAKAAGRNRVVAARDPLDPAAVVGPAPAQSAPPAIA